MSKDQAFPDILFMYNSVPEYTDFYLIPAEAEMSVNLRKAVLGIDGLMVNASDVDNDSKVWKHWAYVLAAITENADHLDSRNEFDANRFHGHLLEFKLTQEELGSGGLKLQTSGDLVLVRAGCIM